MKAVPRPRLTWLNHGQTTCSGSATSESIGPTTTWTYDDRDRVRSVTHRGPPPATGIDGPVLLSRTYERNAAGEPKKITKQDGTYTRIEYDDAGRVEAATHVYYGVRNGKPVSVKITNNLARRQAQHADRFVLDPITTTPLTRGEARAVGQAIISVIPALKTSATASAPHTNIAMKR